MRVFYIIAILSSVELNAASVKDLLVLTGVVDIQREVKQLKSVSSKSEVYTKYFAYKENKYLKVNPEQIVSNMRSAINSQFTVMLSKDEFDKFKSPFFIKFLNLINEDIRLYELIEKVYTTNSLVVDPRRLKQIDNFINFFGLNQIIQSEKVSLSNKIEKLKEKKRSINLSNTNEIEIEIKRLEKILSIFDERSRDYIAKMLSSIRFNEFIQLFTNYNDNELKEFSSFVISQIYVAMKKLQD